MTAKQHNAITVSVNQLTKYVILVPSTKESSGADWAHMYMDHVNVHFGLPTHILFDRGTEFTSCLIGVPNSLPLGVSTKYWLTDLATAGN